jgi:hypothetical protein
MVRSILFVLLLMVNFAVSAQPPARFLNKIKKEHANLIYGREHTIGKLLSWSNFRASKIEEYTGKGESIMMLGSIAYLQDKLSAKYPDFRAEITKPKSAYQLRFTFDNIDVDIYRRMVVAEQWKDSYAYQRPENYYIVYAFDDSAAGEACNYFLSLLDNYYKESNIPYHSELSQDFEYSIREISYEKYDTDYAILNIYDIGKFYGSELGSVTYELHLNDSLITTISENSPQSINLNVTGEHKLVAKRGNKVRELPIKIENGRDYYVRCGIEVFTVTYYSVVVVKGSPKVHLVVPEQGKLEFQAALERAQMGK